MEMGRCLHAVVLLSLCAIAVGALILLLGTASAGHRDIMGDWVVSGGETHLSGETVDVRGNVSIMDGGVLKLENCVLLVNCTVDGAAGLDVRPTGRLVAQCSAIQGANSRMFIRLSNDTLLDGCEVNHFCSAPGSSASGMVLDGGDIILRRTNITDGLGYAIACWTDLSMNNVTIAGMAGGVQISQRGLAGPISVVAVDCGLFGSGPIESYKGIEVLGVQGQPRVDLTLRHVHVEGFWTGAYIVNVGNMDALVEACQLVGNQEGALVSMMGGTVTFRGGLVGRSDAADSVGMTLVLVGGSQFHLDGCAVEGTGRGCVVNPWFGSETRLDHARIDNCSVGVVATIWSDTYTQVAVHNSTITNCTTDFLAEGAYGLAASILVYNTVHVPGSGRVEGAGSFIWAYKDLELGSARWRGGGPMMMGWLLMEDAQHRELARFDVHEPAVQRVKGWSVSSAGRTLIRDLYPAYEVPGHVFRGDGVDIWTTGRLEVEVVDDFLPEMAIEVPNEGDALNMSTMCASGTYVELGSGMACIQVSTDGLPFKEIYSYQGGVWTVPLIRLAEGSHVLAVRGIDLVGNVGNTSTVYFLVDTVIPLIEVPPPPGLVNTTSVILAGVSEPGARLTVCGVCCTVAEDGRFDLEVPLIEGRNLLVLAVEDAAGNRNSSTFEVVMDTLVPALRLVSPADGEWTNAASFLVEALSEPGADVSVNGLEARGAGGEFTVRVDLLPGLFTIRVTATDAAGNRAEVRALLNVDWTPPRLVVVYPEGGHLYTSSPHATLMMEVDEPALGRVTVNGRPRELVDDRLVMECELVEGTNEYNVTVVDLAGNANCTLVVVVLDTTPPTYLVDLVPLGGRFVSLDGELFSTAPAVEVRVVADEPVIVVMQGHDQSSFKRNVTLRVDLREGVNRVAFSVEDRAGLAAAAYVALITVDTTAPPINIIEPHPSLRTREARVVLSGFTDPDCNVTVDGVLLDMLSEGEFRYVVDLEEGWNEINVKAMDRMGNLNSTSVWVFRGGGRVEEGLGLPFVLLLLAVAAVVVVVTVLAVRRRGRRPSGGP